MDLAEIFVGNMKKYRKAAGISQEKLAELCGASHSHIRQIECGSRYPSFGFIKRLSDALQVPAALLFTCQNEKKPGKEHIEAELAEKVLQNIHSAFEKL
ncbi:MAG: helix-turn-helix transcriptional regulator [Spirochaetaceae bacterium]|jgi:transcriptional regulator with XRE-family HTH domain|nr:helix-turn-helix transcriptional regulator [Spirochaetaceae bacterium]